MPETRNGEYVCFVHGHGAKYSSMPREKPADARQRTLPARDLARAREGCGAVCVSARGRAATRKKVIDVKGGTAGWT